MGLFCSHKPVHALVMPDMLSADSRAVMHTAHDHALKLQQPYVCADHLVLALLDHPRVRTIVEDCGADVEGIRKAVLLRNPPDTDFVPTTDPLPKTSTVAMMFSDARWEVKDFRREPVEPQHLLAALLRNNTPESKISRDLKSFGLTRPSVVARISNAKNEN